MGGLGEHSEAVGEAGGHPELPEVVAGEPLADPLAAGGGVGTDVDRHVEDLALDHAHELALGIPELRVEPAERAADRVGMVVLDERLRDAALGEFLLVVRLQEEAAVVGEDSGLDEDDLGNPRGLEPHFTSPRRSRPYLPLWTVSHQARFWRYQRTVARRPDSNSWRGAHPSSVRALVSSMA